jgi:prepilin-type N-terminal cleavage/methylation domain-containing protein
MHADKNQRSTRAQNHAFTFIELLIVITITAILAGMAVPNIKKSIDNFELDNFVKDIYYLCLYLKESAISQGTSFCLTIAKDQEPVRFYATYKNENGQWQAVEGKFAKAYKLPKAIAIASIEPCDKTSIYFYPDGSIDTISIGFKNNLKRQVSLIIKWATGTIQIK